MAGSSFCVPASVPMAKRDLYERMYTRVTHGTGKLFLFAGDQKIEHLNKDFFGEGVSSDASNPEHLFKIASNAKIGVFATQLGLIARYARNYSHVSYLVKMNAKTDLIPVTQYDPVSMQLVSIEDVLRVRDENKLMIAGVGYTIYLGSQFEATMLQEAARLVMQAHAEGMLVVLWIYPRGKAVQDERSVDIVAGAAGVAHSLGADFVKVNPPSATGSASSEELLKRAVIAAGNTGVICSGGASRGMKDFLRSLHAQLTIGQCAGTAVGRNIHQKDLKNAIACANAVAALIYGSASLDEAIAMV